MIYYDYFKKETFNNVLPLGLVPTTQENIDNYNELGLKINNRTFILLDDIKCHLSDGQIIIIPKGFTTDLMSIPKFLWSFMGPFDSAFIADLIHDFLYDDKITQITHFKNNIYQAQKFADKERHKWRLIITDNLPNNNLKVKNFITNIVLKLFAKDFYIRKYQIPN